MPNRCVKQAKKGREYQVNIDALIDRFKKVRALNCNPTDVGLDCYIWNMFFTNSRSNVMSRFL